MEADLFPPDWHYNRAGSASRTWDTPDGTAYTLHLLLASDGVYVLHAVGQQGVQLFPRPIEFQADDY